MPQIVLHIGAFKTGTSYIQQNLKTLRQDLAERGVLFPGDRWADQVAAVRALKSSDSSTRAADIPEWRTLVEHCTNFSGETAVVSMEFLASMPKDKIEAVVESFHPHPVRVILGARDVAQSLPAQWQSEVRASARTWTYTRFVEGATARKPRSDEAGRLFWRRHDWPRILRRWSQAVGVENTVLMTIPPRGAPPEDLWHRFGDASGIPTREIAPLQTRSHESLGADSVEMLRRLKITAEDLLLDNTQREHFMHELTFSLAKRILPERRREELTLSFPPDKLLWAQRRTEILVRRVQHLGPRIVGDLSDLHPRDIATSPNVTIAPETMPEQRLLFAARYGLEGMGASPATGDLHETLNALAVVLAGPGAR